MSIRKRLLFLATVVFLCSCGSSNDGDTPEPKYNISIKTVNEEGKSLAIEKVVWGYLNDDGLMLDWLELSCTESLCEEWKIGFDADGEIRILAIDVIEQPDELCQVSIEGQTKLIADPTKQQDVTIEVFEWNMSCA